MVIVDLAQDGGDGILLGLGYVDPISVSEALFGKQGMPLSSKGAKGLFLDISGDARLGCLVCFGGGCANPVFRGIPASSGGFDEVLP